jgi:hypothetical protein
LFVFKGLTAFSFRTFLRILLSDPKPVRSTSFFDRSQSRPANSSLDRD